MRCFLASLVVFALALGTASHAKSEVVVWEVAAGGNGHAYDLIVDTLAWSGAKVAAESLTPPSGFNSGHLLTISDDAENIFVTDNLGSLIGGPDGAWAGFTDEAVEGQWRWIDDTPGIWQDPVSFPNPIQTAYTNWETNPPEPNSGTSENYLSVRGNGGWNDYSGTHGQNSTYLVEYEPIPEPSTIALVAFYALGLGWCGWRRRESQIN